MFNTSERGARGALGHGGTKAMNTTLYSSMESPFKCFVGALRFQYFLLHEIHESSIGLGTIPRYQYTEADIVSEFMKPDRYNNMAPRLREGINYGKNEIFLDFVETIKVLANSNRQIISSDVNGIVHMSAVLSGMPECKIFLNGRILSDAVIPGTVDFEDIRFAGCVDSTRSRNDRTISFVPPDGLSDLMTYTLRTHVKPLVWVEAQVKRISKSEVTITVIASSLFETTSTATNIEIEFDVPARATNPKVSEVSMGYASYAPEYEAVIWKIRSFSGGMNYKLSVKFDLPHTKDEEATPKQEASIRVNFRIPYFTASGIQVRCLEIKEESGYQALKWVRYTTIAEEYELKYIQTPIPQDNDSDSKDSEDKVSQYEFDTDIWELVSLFGVLLLEAIIVSSC